MARNRVKLGLLFAALLTTGCQSTSNLPASDHLASPSPTVITTTTPTQPDVCHFNGQARCIINPAVTQDTIKTTICVPGWTKTVRPSQSYTDNLKKLQLNQFTSQHPNDPNWTLQGTEEDHRLPLELGGAPSDPTNLSPEEPASPNSKDGDETQFKTLVCPDKTGYSKVGLITAQVQFIAKWLGPYPTYIK